MLYKAVAGKIPVFAWNKNTGLPVTGDAANITATLSKDGAAAGATSDTNPTEIAGGVYVFDVDTSETNAELVVVIPVSSTANVVLNPASERTQPGSAAAMTKLAAAALGIVTGAAVAGTLTTTQMTTDLTPVNVDQYKDGSVAWIGGVLDGVRKAISASDIAGKLTFAATPVPPGVGDSFVIV